MDCSIPEITITAESGRAITLRSEGVHSLGRLVVQDAFGLLDPCMSRDHCQIRWRGRNFWICDGSAAGVNSLLGTYLNGVRIPSGQWTLLPKDALLRVGETTLQLHYNTVYSSDFDLMISYSRKDEKPVLEIFQQMQERGFRPWLDQKTQTEHHYIEGIEQIITKVPVVVIFWGGDRMGHTHAAEVAVAKNLYIQKQIRTLFLVVLPGSEDPQLGHFLSTIDWYDLRKLGELERFFKDLKRKVDESA